MVANTLTIEHAEHIPRLLPLLEQEPADLVGTKLLAVPKFAEFLEWTNDTIDTCKAKVFCDTSLE